jgi:peptidyl-prolyl cis-trans isomerase B (cyclophilin B)
VASTKDRQRKLARARAERRLQALAHKQRRKRQRFAMVGAVLGLIGVVLGATWLLGGFDASEEPTGPTVVQGECSWTLQESSTDANIIDVGHPEPDGAPRTGTQTMTLQTNLGDIEASIDLSKAPCTAASFDFLSGTTYFDDTTCTRYSDELKVLQCGDPIGSGAGRPGYTFADENKPQTPISTGTSPSPGTSPATSPSPGASPSAAPAQYYKKGQIIMVNTGMNTNGSQFYIVTDDTNTLTNAYSVVGEVTKGMNIVDDVAKAGAVDDSGNTIPEGKPKTTLTIKKIVMGEPVQPTPSPASS